MQEALVVALSFDQLPGCLSFSLNCRQGWNDNLRVGSQKEVSQDIEVGVEAFDAPLHGEAIDGDHHALILAQPTQLGCDVLVDASDDTGAAHVARQDGLFGHSRISTAHHRRGSTPLECLVKHIRCAVIKHRVASLGL